MLFNLLASEASNSSSAAPAGNSWMSWVLIIGLVLVIVVFMEMCIRDRFHGFRHGQRRLNFLKDT